MKVNRATLNYEMKLKVQYIFLISVKSRVIQLRPLGIAQDLGKFQVIVTPNGKWKCGECDVERNRKIDIWHHIRQLHMEERKL